MLPQNLLRLAAKRLDQAYSDCVGYLSSLMAANGFESLRLSGPAPIYVASLRDGRTETLTSVRYQATKGLSVMGTSGREYRLGANADADDGYAIVNPTELVRAAVNAAEERLAKLVRPKSHCCSSYLDALRRWIGEKEYVCLEDKNHHASFRDGETLEGVNALYVYTKKDGYDGLRRTPLISLTADELKDMIRHINRHVICNG